MRRLQVFSVLLSLYFSAVAYAEGPANWPQFRGPGARGVAEGSAFPDTWSQTENLAWGTDIPGRGWSSPVVWGKKVFLTTVVNPAQVEAPKKGLYLGGERPDAPDAVLQWKVLCLDLASGKILWEKQVHEGKPFSGAHMKNSYASETPVVEENRVYALFGNVGLWCLDHDGNIVWTKEMTPHATRASWGTASSPALHKHRLYLQNDNEEDSALIALDTKTGEEVWRTPREEKSNWSTPFVWENEQRTEIVTVGRNQSRSYDLDGKLLWSFGGNSKIVISTPYAADGLLYLTSGYVGDKVRPIFAVRPGATGDISLAEGQTSNDFIVWSQPQGAPYNPSTLVYDGRLYVLYDGGMFGCFNAATGEQIFERERIPEARNFTASPWAANGKVYCLNEDGNTYVMKAGTALELLQTNALASGEEEMFMATPAIVGDCLLIRSSARLYCIKAS